jgi:hypothetical protein
MKIIKGLAIFVVAIILGSCFDPPQYPLAPEIEYEGIYFVDAPTDTLAIYLRFKDGDGDLGLDPQNPEHFSYPYNDAFFFLGNNGSLTQVTTYSITPQYGEIINIPEGNPGKLVFPRTRKKAGFSNLPPYQFPFTCTVYNFRKILIENVDLNAIRTDDLAHIDPYIRFTDTVDIQRRRFFEIQDTLYFNVNPDHYNIEVDFLVYDPQNAKADTDGFVEYDWRTDGCNLRDNVGQTFDARFITLSDNNGPLEGTLRYSMYTSGFTETFTIKTLKLRVQIKDRALNKSNVIVTPPFELSRIRKR